MTNIQFRKAEERDREACVDLAVRAFWNDPLFRAAAGSVKNYRLLMAFLTRAWMEEQTAFVAERDGRVVALAVLAEEKQSAFRLRTYWRPGAKDVVRACGRKNIFQFLWVSRKIGKSFQEAAKPRFFLTLLAVEPTAQGKGVGSATLEECVSPYLRERGGGSLCLRVNEEKSREFFLKNRFASAGGAAVVKLAGKEIRCQSFQRTEK